MNTIKTMQNKQAAFAALAFIFSIFSTSSLAAMPDKASLLQDCGASSITYTLKSNFVEYGVLTGDVYKVIAKGDLLFPFSEFNKLSDSKKNRQLRKSGAPLCLSASSVAFVRIIWAGNYPGKLDCMWVFDSSSDKSRKTSVFSVHALNLDAKTYSSESKDDGLNGYGFTHIYDTNYSCK